VAAGRWLTGSVNDWTAIETATAALDPPFAIVDLAAFERNADALVARAGGRPIRLASKSVRCRALIAAATGRAGFSGVMAYSLPEAVWLAGQGVHDILVAYPSVDRVAWRTLAADPDLAQRVTAMVDDGAHLDLIESVRADASIEVRLCIDVDASLRIGRAHLGVRRSPLRTASDVVRLADDIDRRAGMRLVGLMFYDAQVAGLPDSSPAVRSVKRRSIADLATRRTEIVTAVRAVADLEVVNGGGTGSLHSTGTDPVLTELAAGSGLYAPTLFDGYRDFTPEPAAFFALSVVRRPGPRLATVFSGGYAASGPAGKSRTPTPWWPRDLRLLASEGAGEVQTPLRGRAAAQLRIGDRVWFRHAKAGELCERFDRLHLVRGREVERVVDTYRGEGRNFG
jgi:D-serine deaminase-like pyridoxal phosphate-dependent protein